MKIQIQWMRSYFYDYRIDRLHLGWKRNAGDYWPLSSELIFQYHKLEKGLCLPVEARRFFGIDPALETCRLLHEWRQSGLALDAPIYLASIEVLRAWRQRLTETPSPQKAKIHNLLDEVDTLIATAPSMPSLQTPIPVKKIDAIEFDNFLSLMTARRSTRDFDGRPVDFLLIEKAVSVAQLSPSACNRQPWHLHFYEDKESIKSMLALQNGNLGFGQTVPLLAVVTTNLATFFNASERIEPALDGGLFLMSFILALQSLGLSTCCLNWCVFPEADLHAHKLGHIPSAEKILTFLAIGWARDSAVVPLSARRPIADVIRRHSGLLCSV